MRFKDAFHKHTHGFPLIHSGRGQSNEVPVAEGRHYCVDENTERRNHYLDLAGIENYTSRFEGKHFDIAADILLLEVLLADIRLI